MPSLITIFYSMVASSAFILGLIHLFFGLKSNSEKYYLFSALMALAAGACALLELYLSFTTSVDVYIKLVQYENLAIFLIVVPMIWFVRLYLGTGMTWLAVVITLLWLVGIVINFSSPSLTFKNIHEITRVSSYWGEVFSIPNGEVNPWKYITDIASLLVLVFVINASLKKYLQGGREQALLTGGSIIIFILLAGVLTPLTDSQMIALPYMVSPAFLSIIAVFTYLMASDAMRMNQLAIEITKSEAMRAETETKLQLARNENAYYARKHLLGELSTSIAHEINQPLSAIRNNAQAGQLIAASRSPDLKEIRVIFDDIVRDDKRASEIIERVRSLLRTGQFSREPFPINHIVSEVLEFMRYDIARHGISLATELSEDDPVVMVGKIEIQQVLINLLYNAFKAVSELPEGDRLIMIESRLTDLHKVVVNISDNGAGIPEAERDKAFDLYHTSDEEKGLGLGLAISHSIVEAHGGEITIDDSASGGAKFSIILSQEP